MVTTRDAQANSPSFPNTYDASLPSLNLIYLDANNLYGGACLSHCPPTDSDSSSRMRSRHWGSYPMMLEMDTYLKWISAVLIIYTILTATILSPQSSWRLVVICIHVLSEQYFPILHLKGNSLPICGIKSSMWYIIATIPPIGSCSHQNTQGVDI